MMKPTHVLTLTIAVLVLTMGMWGGYNFGHGRGIREGAAIAEAGRQLLDDGWVPVRTDDPPAMSEAVPEIPDVAEREATVTTSIVYRDRPYPPSWTRSDPVEAEDTDVCTQWTLMPDDLALDVRTDMVRVDNISFGIIQGRIKARTPHGEVAREFTTQDAVNDIWARPVTGKTWRLEARIGIESDESLSLGTTYYRQGRVGWWASYARELTGDRDQRVAGGVAFAFGRR